MEEKDIKKYELTFWLKDEDASAVKQVLAKHGAEVSFERPLAKYRLSYPIKGEANAVMGSVAFAVDPAEVQGIASDLGSVAGVLRSFVSTARAVPETAGQTPEGGGEAGAMRGRGGFTRRTRTESPAAGEVLTNEALEKKIEEISK